MKLNITDIQRFCMHDGKGLRTTVFLKGCPLRCEWCHNPETQSAEKQLLFYSSKCIGCGGCAVCKADAHSFDIKHSFDAKKCIACGLCAEVCPTRAVEIIGQKTEIEAIIDTVMRDKAFYGDGGGVTLSGGEPLMQAEAAIELLKELKKRGISTAVETCGFFDERYLGELVGCVDLFLWDIKDTDSERHRRFTGVENERILRNLLAADGLGAKTVLRCIIVDGVNANEAHYRGIADIYSRLKHCEGVELIPYHTYGGSKFEALFGTDNGKREWVPSSEVMVHARETLHSFNINVCE